MKTKKSHALLNVVLFLILLFLIGAAYMYFFYSPLAESNNVVIEKQQQTKRVEKPPTAKSVNILICGLDESESLTDVIMVANLDFVAGKVNVLQIPRDCYIGDDYNSGKINAAYMSNKNTDGKINSLVDVINDTFSLYINHYATITLDSFGKLVDAIGGVPIVIDREINFSPTQIIPKGENVLNGTTAQWFVRYRKGYYNADIGRIGAQEVFLRALLEKVLQMNMSSIASYVTEQFENITTDLTISNAIEYINFAKKLSVDDVEFHIVEGEGVYHNEYAVYQIDREKTITLLNEYFRKYSKKEYDLNILKVEENEESTDDSDWDDFTDDEPTENNSDWDDFIDDEPTENNSDWDDFIDDEPIEDDPIRN